MFSILTVGQVAFGLVALVLVFWILYLCWQIGAVLVGRWQDRRFQRRLDKFHLDRIRARRVITQRHAAMDEVMDTEINDIIPRW